MSGLPRVLYNGSCVPYKCTVFKAIVWLAGQTSQKQMVAGKGLTLGQALLSAFKSVKV